MQLQIFADPAFVGVPYNILNKYEFSLKLLKSDHYIVLLI